MTNYTAQASNITWMDKNKANCSTQKSESSTKVTEQILSVICTQTNKFKIAIIKHNLIDPEDV